MKLYLFVFFHAAVLLACTDSAPVESKSTEPAGESHIHEKDLVKRHLRALSSSRKDDEDRMMQPSELTPLIANTQEKLPSKLQLLIADVAYKNKVHKDFKALKDRIHGEPNGVELFSNKDVSKWIRDGIQKKVGHRVLSNLLTIYNEATLARMIQAATTSKSTEEIAKSLETLLFNRWKDEFGISGEVQLKVFSKEIADPLDDLEDQILANYAKFYTRQAIDPKHFDRAKLEEMIENVSPRDFH